MITPIQSIRRPKVVIVSAEDPERELDFLRWLLTQARAAVAAKEKEAA